MLCLADCLASSPKTMSGSSWGWGVGGAGSGGRRGTFVQREGLPSQDLEGQHSDLQPGMVTSTSSLTLIPEASGCVGVGGAPLLPVHLPLTQRQAGRIVSAHHTSHTQTLGFRLFFFFFLKKSFPF